MPVNRFIARWDREDGCEVCSGPIYEGEEAGYVEDEVACGECCDKADEEEADEISNSPWIRKDKK